MQEGSLWLPLVASGWTVIDMQSELACWDDSWNNKKSDALLIGSDCETYATESCCASTGFRLVELILTFCSYSYSTHNRTHTIFIPYSYLTTLTPRSYFAHILLTPWWLGAPNGCEASVEHPRRTWRTNWLGAPMRLTHGRPRRKASRGALPENLH